MSKKEKVVINRTDKLEAVDQELDVAMDMLDGANSKVSDLLNSYEVIAEEAGTPSANTADVEIQDNATAANDDSSED